MSTWTTFQAAKANSAIPAAARIRARSQYGSDWRVSDETIDWIGSGSSTSR